MVRTTTSKFVRALTLLILLFLVSRTVAQEPAITRLLPAAVNPLSSTTLVLQGDNLQGMTKVWTSFPCASEPELVPCADPESTDVTIRFSLAAGVSPGVGALRVATTNGVSDLQWLMIDDLPSVLEHETNHSRASAQSLAWPGAVDGICEALTEDVFKISARRGQPLSVEVVAHRLGRPLDSLLRIVDQQQREIAYCDDDPRVGNDSRVSVIIPEDADYWIHLRDSAYAGGPNYRYRLRVGNFPLCSMAMPAKADPTNAPHVILRSEGEPLPVPVGQASNSGWLGTTSGTGQGAGFVRAALHNWAVHVAREPNGNVTAANPVDVPASLYGRFEEKSDRDLFRFEAKAGQSLTFRGHTRSLGSPCDLILQLKRSNDTSIATAEVNGPLQGALTNKFTEDGTYFLSVKELNDRSGSDLGYRVDIRSVRAGFELDIDLDKVSVRPGGSFEIKVKAARHGYTGPIPLEIRGLGDDFVVEGGEIAEKRDAVQMKVRVPDSWSPGLMKEFRVVGRSEDQSPALESIARWTNTTRGVPSWWNEMPWNEVVVLGVKSP